MFDQLLSRSHSYRAQNSLLWRLHIDGPLLAGLLCLIAFGLLVLYSAGGENAALVKKQVVRLIIAFIAMFMMAQVPPRVLKRWALPLYVGALLLLVAVLIFGEVGKGAQRWLHIGIRFQPSEFMKIALPLVVAWYMSERAMPPSLKTLAVAAMLVLVPTLLIAKQPDLGTSLLIASSGVFVIFLSGISWRRIAISVVSILSFLPVLWFFLMHDYQRKRVMTFINPGSDPLGADYQITQSKIAIGSGGLYGKGWLEGTQSQLEWVPERQTDFIFAVLGEEFGFFGVLLLLAIYLFIIGRGLYIGAQAQDSFGRLLAGSIILTFSIYIFVNIGMVSDFLPVVGLPLPLVSYGGTSMVTILASLGILMSIHTHRRLVAN